jgi:hypothetical protein
LLLYDMQNKWPSHTFQGPDPRPSLDGVKVSVS